MGGGGSETATLAMSRLYVGKYQLGSDHVKVFLRSGDGGDGYILPPSITIGADVKSWKTVFGALMHEAFEIVLTKNRFGEFDYSKGKMLLITGPSFFGTSIQWGCIILPSSSHPHITGSLLPPGEKEQAFSCLHLMQTF